MYVFLKLYSCHSNMLLSRCCIRVKNLKKKNRHELSNITRNKLIKTLGVCCSENVSCRSSAVSQSFHAAVMLSTQGSRIVLPFLPAGTFYCELHSEELMLANGVEASCEVGH